MPVYLGAHEPIPRPGRRAPALLAKRYRRYRRPRHLVCVPVNPLRQDAGHDRVSVRPRRGAGECNLISCAEGPWRLPYPRRCPGDSRRRARRRRFLARDRIHLRRRPRAQCRGRQAGDPQAAARPRRRPMQRAGRRRRRKVRRKHFPGTKGHGSARGIASRARAFGTRRARVRFPSPPMRDRHDDRGRARARYQPRRSRGPADRRPPVPSRSSIRSLFLARPYSRFSVRSSR